MGTDHARLRIAVERRAERQRLAVEPAFGQQGKGIAPTAERGDEPT